MRKSLPVILILFYLVQTSCSPNKSDKNKSAEIGPSESVAEENNFERINNNLDNFTIRNASEDLETFRLKKPIYSIRYYKAVKEKNGNKAVKRIDGKDFYLQSYTEYLKDGRKRYKEYVYDHGKRVERYHYDAQLQNLLLLHRIEPDPGNEKNHYQILKYHPNKVLKEELKYRTYNGKKFDFEGYTSYKFQKHNDTNTISVENIGYDSIPDPQEKYSFIKDELIKYKPLYQSKKQYLKWILSAYKPIKMEGYVLDERMVDYTYDKKGFITSEIWTKAGTLENKTEYEYQANYAERIQQDYHQLGTEKSSRHLRKYNPQGDLVFEQMIEYTGNELQPSVFEYVYDENDNWTDRRKYSVNVKEGGKKELLEHEKREISYFESGSKIRSFDFPVLSKEINKVSASIPKSAGQKQQSIDEFNKAVEKGNYDTEITKTEAKEIKDFTPKFWKLKATAFGDLDKLPGEEAVAVFETPMLIDPGFEQVLAVFKKSGNKWTLWHQSSSALMGTQDGGMMGNPFDGVAIQNRTIIISHFGGSREKWNYKHIYRYQSNDWYLIGASIHFGAPCDYFADLDYNLSTGDVVAKYAQESCDDAPGKAALKNWTEHFKLKIPLPKMNAFTPGDNKIEIPNQTYEMYY